MWELEEEGSKTRLRPGALPGDELDVVLRLIVGDNQEYPPGGAGAEAAPRATSDDLLFIGTPAGGFFGGVTFDLVVIPALVELSSGNSDEEEELDVSEDEFARICEEIYGRTL